MSETRELRKPHIISAAIRVDEGVFLGETHRHIRQRIARVKKIEDPETVEGVHGFVTDRRIFVKRELAFKIASHAGQVGLNSNSAREQTLYSDDVRPPLYEK